MVFIDFFPSAKTCKECIFELFKLSFTHSSTTLSGLEKSLVSTYNINISKIKSIFSLSLIYHIFFILLNLYIVMFFSLSLFYTRSLIFFNINRLIDFFIYYIKKNEFNKFLVKSSYFNLLALFKKSK